MKKLDKGAIENRKKIRKLLNKEDCDIPLALADLSRLFQNLDPAKLTIAQREYLLESGVPKEVIDDDTLTVLTLVMNIDEWAPALFRLLGKERKRKMRDVKRIIALDSIDENFDKIYVKFPEDNPKEWPSPVKMPIDESYVSIENRALIIQRVIRLVSSSANSNEARVLKILCDTPDISQEEIAKKIGVTQGNISKLLKKVQRRL